MAVATRITTTRLPQIKMAPTPTTPTKPMTWWVEKQVENGIWCEETIPAEVVGLSRTLTVFRASRKTNLIVHSWHGDESTFCPPMWWDLAIGSGACGLGCRACFLMLTHRIWRDPMRHLLYDNVEDFFKASERWLANPQRRRQHTLGVGIDRSDSLLYEGITGHVRRLAPLFADPGRNPAGSKLVLLTKTTNTHYLEDIAPEHRKNVVVSFSLNPEPIADLWEGKWPDGERITPSVDRRLEAARRAQDMGYEIRVRVDPILTPAGWEERYREFVADVKAMGVQFRYWTLGTYRAKNGQLDGWRERWGLPPMEWQPDDDGLEKDGTHHHLPEARRIEIYEVVSKAIRREFRRARVSLCKETHSVRKALKLCNADCNCLI
jgi:DNA repair photolyase